MISALNIFDLLGSGDVVVKDRHAGGRAHIIAESRLGDVDLTGFRNAFCYG